MTDDELEALYSNLVRLSDIVDRALSQIDSLRGEVKTLTGKVEFLSACAWGAVTESDDGTG